MAFNVNSFTLGDMEYFEEVTGHSFAQFDAATMSARDMRAMATITLYRSDQAPDYAQASAQAREMTIDQLTGILNIEGE